MYRNLHGEVSDRVKMLPSEYFRRQCFIAVEPTEPDLGQIVDRIGSDNLISGSDYPHMERQPDVIDNMVGLKDN